MGLAASQARLLVLTARKSDLEFRAQNITNRKLLIATQTEQLAMDYTRALSNRELRFVFDYNSSEMQDINEALTINSLYSCNAAFIGQYRVKLADGRIAVSSIDQLPFAVPTDKAGNIVSGTTRGSVSTSDLQAEYQKLSNVEKLQYLKEAVSNFTQAREAGNADAEKLYSSLGLNAKVDSNGHRVNTLRDTLDSIKDKSASDLSDTDKNALKEFFNAVITSTTKETTLTNAFKNLTTAPTTTTTTGSTTTTTTGKPTIESTENLKDKDFNAILATLRGYMNNSANAEELSGTFFTKNISDSDYNTAITDSTQELLTFLKTSTEAYNAGGTTGVETAAENNLTTFLNNNPNLALNLIVECSQFASRVQNGIAETVVSEDANGQRTIGAAYNGEEYVVLPALNNPAFFQNALREGSITIEKLSLEFGKEASWQPFNWTGSSIIQDELNTTDDALAQAEYETQTAILQTQDKMMDVELRQVETQQKACDNEFESVKKILDKNVERSFKVFS